jgi:FKBP-type peptidyl-prolyl cis-trans isomerase FkpA
MKRFALFGLAAIMAATLGCNKSPTEPDPNVSVTATDLKVGTGNTATSGRFVTVNYTGWLQDTTKPENKGVQFDTSVGRTPFGFILGFNQVIAGWDLGVQGMKVGGIRRLEIPPQLGYGSSTYGSIPGNSTLIFDIELLNVQ